MIFTCKLLGSSQPKWTSLYSRYHFAFLPCLPVLLLLFFLFPLFHFLQKRARASETASISFVHFPLPGIPPAMRRFFLIFVLSFFSLLKDCTTLESQSGTLEEEEEEKKNVPHIREDAGSAEGPPRLRVTITGRMPARSFATATPHFTGTLVSISGQTTGPQKRSHHEAGSRSADSFPRTLHSRWRRTASQPLSGSQV